MEKKAIVKITEWPENQKNPVGKVLEVLGTPGDNDTEMSHHGRNTNCRAIPR